MTRRRDPAAVVFAALADPTRREVVRILSRGPATATELTAEIPISRQAVAKHLQALAEAGLVTAAREGRHRRYRLTPPPMREAVAWMAEVGGEWDERLEALRRHLRRS